MIVKATGIVDTNTEIVVNIDPAIVLKSVDDRWLISYLEERTGGMFVKKEETDHYLNIEKCIGTEPFYDLLVKAIEDGKMSLEMLVGKVAVKKIMKEKS